MCYSALVERSYRQYLRMTGAEMDLPQFFEIFGMRAAGAKITIPRAVERWFDEPASELEEKIAQSIRDHRRATVTELEQELFRQKKRLADAERKLAVKPTRTAADSKRIAEDKSAKLIARLRNLQDDSPREADARIFPMNYAPIVVRENGRNFLRLARYHCRLPGKPASIDRDFPGLYNARRDNIDRYWRAAFGASHAVLLVNSFFENVQRDGRNVVLQFVPRPAETMRVACLYSEWRDAGSGERLLSFAAITDEPPAEVAAAGHDRMIVSLRPENVAAWLSPGESSPADWQRLLSDRSAPFYEHAVMAA